MSAASELMTTVVTLAHLELTVPTVGVEALIGDLRSERFAPALAEEGPQCVLFAVERGATAVARALMACGARARTRTTAGTTALHEALARPVEATLVPLVEDLIAAGCEVNASDSMGRTALLMACSGGGEAMARCVLVLLAAGADPNGANAGTAWASRSALMCAAGAGWRSRTLQVDVVRALIGAGADVNAVDATGASVLFYTLPTGQGDAARLEETRQVLEAGANPNVGRRMGGTLLHQAVVRDDTDAVALLMRFGADPTLTDITGLTPMEVAQQMGRMGALAVFERSLIAPVAPVEPRTGGPSRKM